MNKNISYTMKNTFISFYRLEIPHGLVCRQQIFDGAHVISSTKESTNDLKSQSTHFHDITTEEETCTSSDKASWYDPAERLGIINVE